MEETKKQRGFVITKDQRKHRQSAITENQDEIEDALGIFVKTI